LNLNTEQHIAVTHYGTPQVIIAGAGTGKTTVMISKIQHLIETNKHAPPHILALTFTNKAANEMKHRFESKNPGKPSPTFGTFHSFCLRELKQSPYLNTLGLKSTLTIIDAQQQKDIILNLAKTIPSMGRKPKEILSKISKIKQCPMSEQPEALGMAASDIQQFFGPYNHALRNQNALDFDDILLFTHQLLATNSTALADIQSRYQYVIVDEYQDTNQIQNDITVLIAKAHQNICVVGDFDQTIYSWRGAKIENLLSFSNHFPTASVQKLEINYRSTKEILSAANQLINHNTNRQPKTLISDRVGHQLPQHIVCFNEQEEANYIAKKIKELQSEHHYSPNDMAILYRTNQQSRAIEECLTHHNIPHHMVGTTAFYQRIEIKAAIAFLHCLQNIDHPVWFQKAMLTPARGIGKTSVEKVIAFSLNQNIPIQEAVYHPELPIQARFRSILHDFITLITHVKKQTTTIEDKLNAILDGVQFTQYLKKMEQWQDRLDNLKELKSTLKDTDNLSEFLDTTTLFQGNDDDTNTEKVRCLTLHLAKGLEFPVVFMPGFEDRLLPLRNSDSLEEERRLAYVGITRGKDQVYMLSAYKRTLLGDDWYHNVSTFTKELDGCINISVTAQTQHMGNAMIFKLQNEGLPFTVLKSATENRPSRPAISAQNTAFQLFSTGDVVRHSTLGTGTIQQVSGEGDAVMYDIYFSVGKKKLMAKFARLEAVTSA
jgi:DNA helicase-2/ATP-dependent DNA helicase PcrA